MKTQAMFQWGALERFLFPTKKLTKVKTPQSIPNRGYSRILANSEPIVRDTYASQAVNTAQRQSVNLPVPAAVEFFSWFGR